MARRTLIRSNTVTYQYSSRQIGVQIYAHLLHFVVERPRPAVSTLPSISPRLSVRPHQCVQASLRYIPSSAVCARRIALLSLLSNRLAVHLTERVKSTARPIPQCASRWQRRSQAGLELRGGGWGEIVARSERMRQVCREKVGWRGSSGGRISCVGLLFKEYISVLEPLSSPLRYTYMVCHTFYDLFDKCLISKDLKYVLAARFRHGSTCTSMYL